MPSNDMIERVARAIQQSFKDRIAEPLRMPFEETGVLEPSMVVMREYARAAIEAMREIPVTVQMAGCEGQMFKSIEFDGPLKKHEECNTPDDWMQRGHGLKNRMLSGDEFLAGWNAAIDAALHPIQNREGE